MKEDRFTEDDVANIVKFVINEMKKPEKKQDTFTEEEVTDIINHVINEIYTSPDASNQNPATPPPAGQTGQTQIAQTTPEKTAQSSLVRGGRIDPYMLRDYSFQVAGQLKQLSTVLGGANRQKVANLVAGIFERLSPQWAGISKRKFMQQMGIYTAI